jgi:hypothetical protein
MERVWARAILCPEQAMSPARVRRIGRKSFFIEDSAISSILASGPKGAKPGLKSLTLLRRHRNPERN